MKNGIIGHIKVFFERLSYTFSNLTLHGPSFIVRRDVHFIAKFIYFVIYVHIWIAVIYTIRKYYNHYQENTIRFTTRADYLKWNTTFPSITVCEILNVDKIWALNQDLSGEAEEGKLDRYIGDVAFFGGTCHSCSSTCNSELQCPTDLLELAGKFRSPCKKLFLRCKWNGKPMDCCKSFKPIQTEFGVCYSINNKHLISEKSMSVAADYKNASAMLELDLLQDYEAFLHSPEDIPFWNMEYDRRVTVVFGAQASMTFSIMDVVNEPEVSLTPPDVRKCRFIDEVPEHYVAYDVYSYSVCITQCRINAQLKLCNCTHHFSPLKYINRYCDLEGLKCLTQNFNELRRLKVAGLNQTGIDCDCLPSCTETEYNIAAKSSEEPYDEAKAGSVKFVLGNRPYQRITRQVARTTLDLVVAMGNCFGLCFGGSLLSIAEILYYICFKKWKQT